MSSHDIERPRILNSWKEIAAYLDRGVRTVQRWEATMGLPVHRPRGRLHSSVFALAHEIDQWMLRTPSARLDGDPVARAGNLRERLEASRLLRKQARELVTQLRAGVRQHNQTYVELKSTLARAIVLAASRSNGSGPRLRARLSPSPGQKTGSAA